MELKQVILVRLDLNMGKGKTSAQCVHAGIGASDDAKTKDPAMWKAWHENLEKVVVLASTLEQIRVAMAEVENLKLPYKLMIDAGLTEIEAHTITCLAIGPAQAEIIDKVTGTLEPLR